MLYAQLAVPVSVFIFAIAIVIAWLIIPALTGLAAWIRGRGVGAKPVKEVGCPCGNCEWNRENCCCCRFEECAHFSCRVRQKSCLHLDPASPLGGARGPYRTAPARNRRGTPRAWKPIILTCLLGLAFGAVLGWAMFG